jgi:hypothetical protein
VSNGSSTPSSAQGELSPPTYKEEDHPPPKEKEEPKAQKPESPKEPEPPAAQPEPVEKKKDEKFDPSTDLNIFEQINFDEMNINLEDINQSN